MRKPIGNALRFKVLERDGFRCQYCGAGPKEHKLQVDHILSVFNGGGNNIDNLITSYQPCNIGKHKRMTNYIVEKDFSLSKILQENLYEEVKDIFEIYNTKFPKFQLEKKYVYIFHHMIKKDCKERLVYLMQYYCDEYNDFNDTLFKLQITFPNRDYIGYSSDNYIPKKKLSDE